MDCPYCSTENRDDAEVCYHCGKDVSMLRLIVNKARHHYNVALEHAERQRYPEALTELEHAIELDGSFAPAHVVMGTVHAKMEDFDAAKRCWLAALALDPHILKAHEYLDKSDVAVRAAPLVRRVRRAIAIALGAAVVFLVASAWLLRPSPDRRALSGIVGAVAQGNYETALREARRLAQVGSRRETRQAAKVLEQAIGQRYESAGMTMLTFLLENKPIEAHKIYRSLTEKQALPAPYGRQLDSLDQKAAEQVATLLDSWEQLFTAGELSYADIEEKTGDLREVFDRRELLERIDGLLGSARRTWVAETLDLVPTSPASTSETLTWLARLSNLAEKTPDSRDKIASATERLVRRTIEALGEKTDQALAGKDRTVLQSVLADLGHFRAMAGSEDLSEVAGKARGGLRRLEIEQLKARLSAAKTADIPQVDRWIASFEKSTSTTVESIDELADLTRRTRRRLAAEMLRWCTARDPRFEQRQITEEEARWMSERAEFVLRYVVGRDWRYLKDNTTFYAGVSWLVLGDGDEAVRWFDRLEKDYPESPYLPLGMRYRAQIEDGATTTTSPPVD